VAIELISHEHLTLVYLHRYRALELGQRDFVTPPDSLLQMAFFNYPKGQTIQPHIHKTFVRSIPKTAEVIGVKRGRLQVDFYDEDKSYLKSVVMTDGDFIVLLDGGHGFKVLEDCEFFEVKQGPFVGTDLDKIKF